jgi:hypothetical protein
MAKTVMFDKDGKPFFRVTLRKGLKDTTFVDETLEENGYTKSLKVKIIIRREMTSERSFLRKVGFFATELHYEIPSDMREHKMTYFYFEPKHMTNICVKNFATKEGYAFSINPLDRDFLKSKTKLTRITENQVRAMIQNKEVLAIFSEGSEGILEELAQ